MEADYQRLKSGWLSGARDRDDALHLMFHAWFHWAEPDFLTGMADDGDAIAIWPWALGDQQSWERRGALMERRAFEVSDGFGPEDFEGRGEYGRYFAHHSRS